MDVRDPGSALGRQRLEGRDALARALDAGLPVRCVVVPEGALPPELAALCERAEAAGAEILPGERRLGPGR